MRLNTINDNYVMISLTELTQEALNSAKERKIRENILDIIWKVYRYKLQGYPADVIGVKKTEKLLEVILNEYVSSRKLCNALMYAISHGTDETITSLLIDMIKKRENVRLKDLKSNSLEDFIIKNSDYNYIDDVNVSKSQDKDFLLYEDDDLIRINLEESYVPELKNPDVK